MTALRLIPYFFRRHYKKLLIFAAALLLMSFAMVLMTMNSLRGTKLELGGGTVLTRETYYGTVTANPFATTNTSVFSMVVAVIAIFLVKRERKAAIARSIARHQFLLGTAAFLLALSAAMAVVMWIEQMLGVLLLISLGFFPPEGWDVMTILTGNNQNILADVLMNFLNMFAAGAYYTLIGYLFARWWKALLVIMGAGIVLTVIFFTQVNRFTVSQDLIVMLQNVVDWAENVLVPWIERWYAETRLYMLALRPLTGAAASLLLCYPIILRMPAYR